jgi:hypothetical protein
MLALAGCAWRGPPGLCSHAACAACCAQTGIPTLGVQTESLDLSLRLLMTLITGLAAARRGTAGWDESEGRLTCSVTTDRDAAIHHVVAERLFRQFIERTGSDPYYAEIDQENLTEAFQQVASHKGAAGSDRQSIEQVRKYL